MRVRLIAATAAIGTLVMAGMCIPFAGQDLPEGAKRERALGRMNSIRQALDAWSSKHSGTFPGGLAEVDIYFPDGVPLDPYTGLPFHYARTQGGYVLSCFGADGAIGGTSPEDRDIVFTSPPRTSTE